MKNELTIIIITGNESKMIEDCIKSCAFADNIILVTTPVTSDDTVIKAKVIFPKIQVYPASSDGVDFSTWRNTGAKYATTKWILYVDADERITPPLKAEILTAISQNKITNFDIPRANYFLGHRVRYGNSYPDYVKRLFLKSSFNGYQGKLHEQPNVSGLSSKMKNDFQHFTHQDLHTMLDKSLKWTPLESDLLFNSKHPPIVWWRIIRMMLTKLWERLVAQQMWRDGTVGWISAIFETFDTFLIYSQLWEKQQHNV